MDVIPYEVNPQRSVNTLTREVTGASSDNSADSTCQLLHIQFLYAFQNVKRDIAEFF